MQLGGGKREWIPRSLLPAGVNRGDVVQIPASVARGAPVGAKGPRGAAGRGAQRRVFLPGSGPSPPPGMPERAPVVSRTPSGMEVVELMRGMKEAAGVVDELRSNGYITREQYATVQAILGEAWTNLKAPLELAPPAWEILSGIDPSKGKRLRVELEEQPGQGAGATAQTRLAPPPGKAPGTKRSRRGSSPSRSPSGSPSKSPTRTASPPPVGERVERGRPTPSPDAASGDQSLLSFEDELSETP